MKGKRPTKKQKQVIANEILDNGKPLNPQNWLVKRNLLHQGELHIVNRSSGKERVILCGHQAG